MVAVRLLCLCTVLACPAAAKAQQAEVQTVAFKADLAVDAEGSPVIGQIEGVTGNLADLVLQQLSRMPYVPAQSNGTPVSSTATIQGRLVLTPVDGDRFEVRLDRVAAGPAPVRRAPIPYPPSQARARASGHAEVLVTLDGAGKVIGTSTVSSSHKAFEDAVVGSLRRWQFDPVSPAPMQVPVTAVFHMADQEPPSVQFECRMDPGRLHVSGQSGCVDQLTVKGEIVR